MYEHEYDIINNFSAILYRRRAEIVIITVIMIVIILMIVIWIMTKDMYIFWRFLVSHSTHLDCVAWRWWLYWLENSCRGMWPKRGQIQWVLSEKNPPPIWRVIQVCYYVIIKGRRPRCHNSCLIFLATFGKLQWCHCIHNLMESNRTEG